MTGIITWFSDNPNLCYSNAVISVAMSDHKITIDYLNNDGAIDTVDLGFGCDMGSEYFYVITNKIDDMNYEGRFVDGQWGGDFILTLWEDTRISQSD